MAGLERVGARRITRACMSGAVIVAVLAMVGLVLMPGGHEQKDRVQAATGPRQTILDPSPPTLPSTSTTLTVIPSPAADDTASPAVASPSTSSSTADITV